MSNIVKIEGGKARLSNEELKRRAAKAIYEGNHIVFESLPQLVAQIIEHRVWEGYGHDSFASFALDAGSNGLGVNTNQRLWILRCSMDAHGAHITEWADVLAKVETLARITASESGIPLRKLSRKGLEHLAKDVCDPANARITYLPSHQTESDGHLLRLRKNHPDTFRRVLSGEMTPREGMLAARKKDGERVNHDKRPLRVRSDFMLLSDDEKREFIKWLRSEGYVK